MKKGAQYIKMATNQGDSEALKEDVICLENGVNINLQEASFIFEKLYEIHNHDEDTFSHLIHCLKQCDPQKAATFI